jgi:DNA repair exonuclease SbcCD ATPase subunit
MGNYEHFNQLMLAENGALSVEQQQFKDLHERICYNARQSAEHWVEMANGIREMRDGKRYRAAGFESFGDYTENALGIKERQAYNYISVIEKLPGDFIRAHSTIGVTKLALLTSVTEEERDEILERLDLDSANTSEINAAVKAAIEERDKATQQLALVLEEKAVLEKENAEYQTEYSELAKEQKDGRAEQKRLEEENAKLRARLAEAEKESAATPVVYQPDPEQAKKLDKAEEEKHVLEDRIASTDKALENERATKAVMEREMEDLRKRLEQTETKKAEPAKVEIKGDCVVVFKAKFETLQDVLEDMSELMEQMDEETAKKCRAAVHSVLENIGI